MFKKIILAILIITSIIGCKKNSVKSTNSALGEIQSVAEGTDNGGSGYTCTTYIPLVPQSDGSYTCTYAGVPIRVSDIRYRIYDDVGNPWPIRRGDPVLGAVTIADYTQGTYTVKYSSSYSPKDDQFTVTVYSTGMTTVNLSTYQAALTTYINNQTAAAQNGTVPAYLLQNAMPLISNYMTTGSASSHDVTGRIIRIPEIVLSCDPVTNVCVTTTFALAPPCFTRPGDINPA